MASHCVKFHSMLSTCRRGEWINSTNIVPPKNSVEKKTVPDLKSWDVYKVEGNFSAENFNSFQRFQSREREDDWQPINRADRDEMKLLASKPTISTMMKRLKLLLSSVAGEEVSSTNKPQSLVNWFQSVKCSKYTDWWKPISTFFFFAHFLPIPSSTVYLSESMIEENIPVEDGSFSANFPHH